MCVGSLLPILQHQAQSNQAGTMALSPICQVTQSNYPLFLIKKKKDTIATRGASQLLPAGVPPLPDLSFYQAPLPSS